MQIDANLGLNGQDEQFTSKCEISRKSRKLAQIDVLTRFSDFEVFW